MSNIELSTLSAKYGFTAEQILNELKHDFSFYIDEKERSNNPELAKQFENCTETQLEITEHSLSLTTVNLNFDITAVGYRSPDFERTVNFKWSPEETFLCVSCDPSHRDDKIREFIGKAYGYGTYVLKNDICPNDKADPCHNVVKEYCSSYFYKLNMKLHECRTNEIDCSERYCEDHDYCQVKLHLSGKDGNPKTFVVGYILPRPNGYSFFYVHNPLPLNREQSSLLTLDIINFIAAPLVFLVVVNCATSFINYLVGIANIGIYISSACVRNAKVKFLLKILTIILSLVLSIISMKVALSS